MGAAARHRGTRSGTRRRLTAVVAWRRFGAAAVCSLVVVPLLGYSSHPVQGVDDPLGEAETPVDTVRAAMMASAPFTFLGPVAASVTVPTSRPAAAAEDGDDIPGRALVAYRRAAAVLAEAAPARELSWTLLAAVGRVESDHGRYGDAVLGDDGVSRPHIVGVPLDGTGPVAEIRDSDDGRLDGDDVWDRAVGPMQFLPTTWSLTGVDGDGDGIRNPHDLDDATLAAAVYLCAGAGNLSRPADMRSALLRYNSSAAYVALVMAYEHRYRTGRVAVTSGPALPTAIEAAEDKLISAARARAAEGASAVRDDPTRKVRRPRGGGTKTVAASLAPVPVPATRPTPPVASDSDGPPQEGLGFQQATDPRPADPDGDTAAVVDPDRVAVTGVWTECDAGFCLDGNPLLLGGPELLTETAQEDYDSDGETAEYATELAGLVDTTVVVIVDKSGTGWTVVSVNDLAYPSTSGPSTSD
jgi:membrane-bound lytic murein transglycosylase B